MLQPCRVDGAVHFELQFLETGHQLCHLVQHVTIVHQELMGSRLFKENSMVNEIVSLVPCNTTCQKLRNHSCK